ncbi:MAG: nucleoside phosphorylase [Caldisericia bacterium]|nr:nucleoside phosphorylase [Caldisericia bacterium]
MAEAHIKCEREDISEKVILVGNPDRAKRINSLFLKDSKLVNEYRSLLTYTGFYKNERITIATTGMGSPSAAIVLEELIKLNGKIFIRVGSAGGLNPEIQTGDLVIATAAIRDDGTSPKYLPIEFPAVPDFDLTNLLIKKAKENFERVFYGVVISSDGFYVGYDNEKMKVFVESNVQAVEMESGVVFIVSQRRGVKAGAIFVIDGNITLGKMKEKGKEKEFSEGEFFASKIALETLSEIKI